MAILLGYRGEQHVPRALESGQLSGHCGLRIGLNGERPVAIDPEQTSALRQPGDPHPFIDDAFDLGGVSTLALLLRSDLRIARDRRFEYRLELGPSGDLAADVADDPTEPAAQQAQLAMVALELLGMGIAQSIIAAHLEMRRYDCRSRT